MAGGLTVVIPSRNDANLAACIEAVNRHDPGLRFLVIDDGLKRYYPETFPGIKPFIFARNANLGLRLAAPQDVILLNDDALLETPGGFTAMQRAAAGALEFGIVSAITNLANNPRQLVSRAARAQASGAVVRDPGMRDAGAAVAFVAVLIPRRTIDRIGMLDERYAGEIDGEMIYGGEDTDYCYRARKAGLKIGVFDWCFVDHASLPSTFRPDGRGLSINATRKRFREIHGVDMQTQ